MGEGGHTYLVYLGNGCRFHAICGTREALCMPGALEIEGQNKGHQNRCLYKRGNMKMCLLSQDFFSPQIRRRWIVLHRVQVSDCHLH